MVRLTDLGELFVQATAIFPTVPYGILQLELIDITFLFSDATATASSGPSSLLSTDSTASSSAGGHGVHKYSVSSAAASRQMAPKSIAQPVDESALFQSLEPAECKKVRSTYDVRIV